mmetsp:Transcript_118782/g.177542  ORF Transcript_118782/g.177542 Transcript_118782/m.177542 type:complete len:103 (-) Transcript_118782:220-528(-)
MAIISGTFIFIDVRIPHPPLFMFLFLRHKCEIIFQFNVQILQKFPCSSFICLKRITLLQSMKLISKLPNQLYFQLKFLLYFLMNVFLFPKAMNPIPKKNFYR